MPILRGRLTWISMIALLVGPLWTSPAAASFIATWNVVPHTNPPTLPPPSAQYDCPTWAGGGLICDFLWDQGLDVSSQTFLPMYGDSGPFYDAHGTSLPFASNLDSGVLKIDANCRTGLDPCIDTFTRTTIVVDLFAPHVDAGVFFRSNKGGLVLVPSGLQSVKFTGPAWTDIGSIDVGIFLPDECKDPNTDLDCSTSAGELGLDINLLTFDATTTAVPEPTSVMLLGTGLLAIVRRYRKAEF